VDALADAFAFDPGASHVGENPIVTERTKEWALVVAPPTAPKWERPLAAGLHEQPPSGESVDRLTASDWEDVLDLLSDHFPASPRMGQHFDVRRVTVIANSVAS
jgi:hypothetical protein